MRIVFVGGGTGGHFYPLIAIAEALIERAKAELRVAPDLYYMGPDQYDAGSLFNSGITFIYCPAGKLRRYRSVLNIGDFFKALYGTVVALYKLFVLYPDVIMSKGGYTSVPIVIAAWLLRIPIVVHESDASVGRANLIAAKLATYIAITYDDTVQYLPEEKVALTGIPVRKELLLPPSPNARAELGLLTEKPLILVLGGSQGAERVNDLILTSLPDILPSFEVIHQTGVQNEKIVQQTAQALLKGNEFLPHYHVKGFLDSRTLHNAESVASLVISRAGSGSIYEIALHGKPSILIPIPEDISHDQRKNAYAYARTGAAEVIEEKNLTPHLLMAEITRIMESQELYNKMSDSARKFGVTDAAERIADALVRISDSHGS